MYSAYVVDNAKYFCNLVYEDTSLPAKIMAYPDVDHLVSTSADMSELVNPSNRGLPEPNQRQTLAVPKYPVNGFPMLSSQIVHELTDHSDSHLMFDQGHTITYIRLPTAEAYVFMGGGWRQERLHPPPKRVTYERERERKTILRGKLLFFSFMSHEWGYIGT